jgi:hypothetical protein
MHDNFSFHPKAQLQGDQISNEKKTQPIFYKI